MRAAYMLPGEFGDSMENSDQGELFQEGTKAYQRKRHLEKTFQEIFPHGPPRILCVTKGRDIKQLKGLVSAFEQDSSGVNEKLFLGENRIEELEAKKAIFDLDPSLKRLSWCYLGPVQSRKAKRIAKHCDVILTIDSIEKLLLIEKYLCFHQRSSDLYIQVNISQIEGRTGFSPQFFEDEGSRNQLLQALSSLRFGRFAGIMAMATSISETPSIQVYHEFLKMQRLRLAISQILECKMDKMALSTGMSDDCMLAALCGSSFVRLGRVLWDDRAS